ncbi:hypothetical protein RCH12_003503, partial [Cryobacterium sp. MP_3.1]|nr:hypothetical protein [Cryobacterium sp. MP_3.1]
MSTIEDVFAPGPGTPPGSMVGCDGSADALTVAVEAVLGLGCCSADYDALSDAQVL